MADWPHAPLHRPSLSGSQIVTAATYQHRHLLRGNDRLTLFQERVLNAIREAGLTANAWSFFSNHYHVILAGIPEGYDVGGFFQELHGSLSSELNELDGARGRKCFFQYWDSGFRDERSYLARLRYVMDNPVRHGLVRRAQDYPFCSASWFAKSVPRSFLRTVETFKIDRVSVPDQFEAPVWNEQTD